MSNAPAPSHASAHRSAPGDGPPMSGTLLRLGARALGQGWTVRSDVRLPFAADRYAEPAPGASGPAAAAETPYAATTPSPAPPLRSPTPTRADEQLPSPAQVPTSRATPPDRTNPRRAGQRNAPPDPTLPAMAVDTGPMAAAPPDLSPDASPVPHPAASDRAMPTAVSTMLPPVLPPAPAPLLPSRGAETTSHPAAPAHRVPSAPARWAAGSTPAGPPPTGETEVHIHIGRIEVTALQEAPRPKARPRERAQPMSLDTYLDQRRKTP